MTAGSKRDSSKRRGGRSRLTEDDRSLWQRIASSVEPLQRAKPRIPEVETPTYGEPAVPHAVAPPPSSPPLASSTTKPYRIAAKRRAETSPASAKLPSAERPAREGPSPLPTVQRRQARRIASGAIEIEARLDLHGLTQSTAHARLVAFLQGSAQRGLKTVLVITGKGAGRERGPAAPVGREREEIGVLRRSVPRWLAEAPLRALVISYQTAAPRHGGDGAFYILLRRSRCPEN